MIFYFWRKTKKNRVLDFSFPFLVNLVFLVFNEFIIGLHTVPRILKIVKDKVKYRLMFQDFVIFLGTHLYLELTFTCAESFQKRFYFHFTLSCIYTYTVFFLPFLVSPFLLFLFLYLSAYNLLIWNVIFNGVLPKRPTQGYAHFCIKSLFLSSFSQSCKTGERLVWQVAVIVRCF